MASNFSDNSSADPSRTPSQSPTSGGAASTHDARKGPQFTQADPPASRMPLIGTVAGNNQRKPFNVK